MNGKVTKRVKKILPVGMAMGVLFSAVPVTENKVEAKVDIKETLKKVEPDVVATVILTVAKIYETFGQAEFVKWLDYTDVRDRYTSAHENVAYAAPTFQKGEFGITVFDYYKEKDFSKKIKIAHPDGKVEYKTIKYGEQVVIKQAGTIVDLTPDEPELNKHDLLYITQKQLDEGNTGVSLTRYKTYYLQSDNSGNYNQLADAFVRTAFPGAYLDNGSGVLDIRYNWTDLFNKLPEEQKRLAINTSKAVGKEALSNYVTNNPEELADFNNRLTNLFADSTKILETPITSVYSILNDGNPYQIIPIQKGTNKVIVKKGSKYLSGKEETALQYSDVIGDDEVFELVLIDEKSYDNKFQFHLVNKNGVPLVAGLYNQEFRSPDSGADDLYFTTKSNNEVHNWLREWYPGKENEIPKYEKIEFDFDKNDTSIWTAYDSGKLIMNNWIERDGNRYYAGSKGVLLKGWQDIGENRYYFNPNSNITVTGSTNYTQIDGNYYLFGDDGALQRSTWKDLEYSDASGALIKEGLRDIEGKIYYFQDYKANTKELRLEDQNVILHFSDKGVLEKASDLNGNALNAITRVNFDGKTLVFESDGSIRKTGVSKIFLSEFDTEKQAVIVYYNLEEGDSYSGWKEIDGKKYHFKEGKHYTLDGHETIDGQKYYFNHEGVANPTGFVKKDGKIYYYDDKGVMQTGWQKINGEHYYFDDSGAVKTGRFVGTYETTTHGYGYFKYQAREDGSIYKDTTIEIEHEGVVYVVTIDSHGHVRKSVPKK